MNFFLKVRDYLFFHSAAAGLLDHLSDEKFVAAEYRRFMGEKINLEKPKKFTTITHCTRHLSISMR